MDADEEKRMLGVASANKPVAERLFFFYEGIPDSLGVWLFIQYTAI